MNWYGPPTSTGRPNFSGLDLADLGIPSLDEYIAKYCVQDLKSAGSSLKFCLMAAGEADIYPRLGRTMEWDTAAGDAVLRGAGGRMVRFDDHAPFAYGKPGFENTFFIAYAPGTELKQP